MSTAHIEKNIFLIGFMGAGKSTIARALQRRLDLPLVEMDQRISYEQGMAITDIFAAYGEERFRDIESELVRTLGQQAPAIVSCGGGVVVRPENVEEMKKSGVIVFLTATPRTVYKRVKDSSERPILNGNMNEDYIAGLMEKRRPLYECAASVTVATDGRTRDEICDEILELIGKQGEEA